MDREELVSIHEDLTRDRVRPGDEVDEAARRLAARTFTGGELWPEWEAALAAADDRARRRALDQVAAAWGEPLPELAALRHGFRARALRAHHRRLHCMCLGPPASPVRVVAWEAEYGPLPPCARALLLETGTVHGDIDQECYSFAPDSEFFAPIGADVNRELFMVDEEEMDEALAALGHVLRAFADGEAEPLSTRGFSADGAPAHVSHLWSFFEGNHGDSNLVLALAGPHADQVFEWSNFQHGGGPVRRAGHIVDVLYEGYFQGFIEWILEEEESDERLASYGRYAVSPLRLVKDGLLERGD